MLNDDIRKIKGIGEKKAQAFNRLGVFSLSDLISYFPRRYEDRSTFKAIALTSDGEQCCISAVIANEPVLTRIRRGLDIVRFRAADESAVMEISYFNQSYMKNSLRKGDEMVFFGKVEIKGSKRSMINPVCERAEAGGNITGRIIPVYGLTAGLNQKTVLSSVSAALDDCADELEEIIPAEVICRLGLVSAPEAYRWIHSPESFAQLENARKRLVFQELFVLSCALGVAKNSLEKCSGIALKPFDFSEFYSLLPYKPTGAQQRAISEAAEDMLSGKVMNRLIQGDVGSGKTLCAAALAWLLFKNELSTALMVPTGILAEQHCASLGTLLEPYGIGVELITGATSAAERNAVMERLKSGETSLVIGTHALITGGFEIPRLGLVITDEQHRFGVNQRAMLAKKSENPHILVMSATPIPRTLSLIIYGDMDVSIIDELPPGRQTVGTFAVDSRYEKRLINFILKNCSEGHQVFVVCPKVEADEEAFEAPAPGLKSAEEYTLTLRSALPELRIACVHGKMKPAEKDAVMQSFAAGETNVLVSTTVVEVGVDVPNATLMIIENAERFGLSQLHQLRGRVGRGSAKSYCVLVSDSAGENTKARLDIMCATCNGFEIAEEDLRIRGPGDFFGSRQHGLPEMHIASLGADTAILKQAQEEAKLLLSEDPNLERVENRRLRELIGTISHQTYG